VEFLGKAEMKGVLLILGACGAGRRRWMIVGTCLAVIGLGVGWSFWPQRSGTGFTRSQYDRILMGMTRAEVEAIMGM
jgi:hypothetical protein